jgi:hypothetical protein
MLVVAICRSACDFLSKPFLSRTPTIAKRVNVTLNTRCSFHPKLLRIPPHEHGTYGLNMRIKDIYNVNNSIREYER